jgi:hypothetical protein
MTAMDNTRSEAQTGNGHSDLASERQNLINTIAVRRSEIKEATWYDIAIPGYDNLLWARYVPYEVAKTERRFDQLRKQSGRSPILLKHACNTLIDSCEQLMLLPSRFEGDIGHDGENLIQINPDAEPLIAFDARAAELFVKGIDKSTLPGMTGTQVVLSMFPTEQSVMEQARKVNAWLNDTTVKADGILMGE